MDNCSVFGNQTLKFPLGTDIKIFTEAGLAVETVEVSIDEACIAAGCKASGFCVKTSTGGKYKSYTIYVNLQTSDQMTDVYNNIGKIAGVKMVL